MHRVLVVDDEQIITDAIYNYLMENLELELYRAYSAYDSIEYLRKLRFDLVITDICMPGMSGLELLEIIKANWPLCHVIILTGYDNFQYAYKVLQYDDVSYLLKTEEYDSILKAVKKELDSIDRELRQDEVIASLGKRITKVMPILQRELLGRLLFDREMPPSRQELDEVELSLDVGAPVLLLTGRVDGGTERLKVLQINRIYQTADYLLNRTANARKLTAEGYFRHGEMIWMIQLQGPADSHPSGFFKDCTRYLFESLPIIQQQCIKQTDASLSFAMGIDFICWDRLQFEIDRLINMLNSSLGLNEGALLQEPLDPLIPSRKLPGNFCFGLRYIQKIQGLLQTGRKEECLGFIEKIFGSLRNASNMKSTQLREVVSAISWLVLNFMNQWGRSEINVTGELLAVVTGDIASSGADWLKAVLAVIGKLFELRDVERLKDVNWAVHRVKTYVEQHYHEELSLVGVSELVHFNSSYFSRLFKETTGENLQEYINRVRLNHAKEFLRGTMEHVSEIAVKVGFTSSKYFITVFKKDTGRTPVAWREFILQQNRQGMNIKSE